MIVLVDLLLRSSWMGERVTSAHLVGRMFETVDFVSLPLFDAGTHFILTHHIALIVNPLEEDNEAYFQHLQLVRVSVFEPTKQYTVFSFHNWDRLRLGDVDRTELECHLSQIHSHLNSKELLSDGHDAEINRTEEWRRNNRERQKRREVLRREEGWDDAFELRVMGIEKDERLSLRSVCRQKLTPRPGVSCMCVVSWVNLIVASLMGLVSLAMAIIYDTSLRHLMPD
ncbi:hypothetical protein BLNAU_14121 [Blattamonas nauphoetae]|uniref:Uncharacterized protein n=1 Tax=Blattamonas nauphoetae TaxID=2049346 RepID=A0ABQ9XEN2_9EUKA|nr:hypothetical protein BLNAU_14121 [Blattamonas nauphoetae]